MDGEEIRARRVALGMSQEELAEATGLSRSFVSHLELNYKKPGDDTAGRRSMCSARPTSPTSRARPW